MIVNVPGGGADDQLRNMNRPELMPDNVPEFLHGLFSVPEIAAASDYCLNSTASPSGEVGHTTLMILPPLLEVLDLCPPLQREQHFVAENFLLNVFAEGVACLSLHPPDLTGEYCLHPLFKAKAALSHHIRCNVPSPSSTEV